MKRYYIESLGCAKNQVDSERLMARLEAEGYVRAENPHDAGLIVVNTCAFIESAKRESIETILSFKKRYPGARLAVYGCLAERYKAELPGLLPEVDEFHGVPSETPGASPPPRPLERPQLRPLLSLPGSAYVKISEGCNNHCAFCAIPSIRGPLHSRPIESITAECQNLLEHGVKELVLIAQDTSSYGMDTDGKSLLTELLRSITGIADAETPAGDFWVRLLYLHPSRLLEKRPLLDELLSLMREDRRILPYFDLPFQHAAPGVLKAMGRNGGTEAFQGLIGAIRAALPHSVIRSTFLVGFPGETDEDFDKLLDFQKEAALDWLGVFTYSREEGTAAYTLKGRPSKKTAEARKARLLSAQEAITRERLSRFNGIETRVLIEENIGENIQENVSGTDDNAADSEGLLYLGRLMIHAPDIDGSAVIESAYPLTLGQFAPVRTVGTSGVDTRCRAYGGHEVCGNAANFQAERRS